MRIRAKIPGESNVQTGQTTGEIGISRAGPSMREILISLARPGLDRSASRTYHGSDRGPALPHPRELAPRQKIP